MTTSLAPLDAEGKKKTMVVRVSTPSVSLECWSHGEVALSYSKLRSGRADQARWNVCGLAICNWLWAPFGSRLIFSLNLLRTGSTQVQVSMSFAMHTYSAILCARWSKLGCVWERAVVTNIRLMRNMSIETKRCLIECYVFPLLFYFCSPSQESMSGSEHHRRPRVSCSLSS